MHQGGSSKPPCQSHGLAFSGSAGASLDCVVVVDTERITLAAFLAALVARRTFPEARYHFAAPQHSAFLRSTAHRQLADDLGIPVQEIPDPGIEVEGRAYRITNKVQALASFGARPALLCDSDLFFLRPVPHGYLSWRTAPAAVPEHGIQEMPWDRLYDTFSLPCPTFQHLCGNGGCSLPWFNAGLVVAPDAEALGAAWLELCHRVNDLPWVQKRFPYLDQIALPLAMAAVSTQRQLTPASVLDARLNQNLFHWHRNQAYVGSGIGLHHHGRLSLVDRYLPELLPWVRAVHPAAPAILERYGAFEVKPPQMP